MEYVVIGLLMLIIILIIIVLVKKNDNEEVTHRLGKFETDITKELVEFKF